MAPTKRRAPGDGSLFKRGDGYWIGQVDIIGPDGERRRKTVSSKDRNTAMKKLKTLQRQIDTGHILEAGHTTVEQWCDKWLREIRGPVVDPGTYVMYEKCIRLYILPTLGAKRLDKLAPEDVRAMVKRLQEQRSTRAAQNGWRVLNMVLKDAVKNEKVLRNVCDATYKPKHAAAESRALDIEEARLVMNLADSSGDDTWATRVAMSFFTGPRPSELLGLRWAYVDLDAATMRLEWQLQRLGREHGCDGTCGRTKPGFCPQARWRVPPGFEMQECAGSLAFTRPKTAASRRPVPLVEPLRMLLTSLRATDGHNPHDLVFHHDDGRPISPEQDWKAWSRLFKAAGIEGVTRYASRHTTATLLMGFGADSHVVQRVLGHTNITTTQGYQHAEAAHMRSALEKLAGLRT
jgi:integrase